MTALPTVLIIGDSVPLGALDVVQKQITDRVSHCFVDSLRTAMPDVQFVVDALPERTTEHALPIVDALLAQYRPDVVLPFLGGSDCDVQWRRFVITAGRSSKSNVLVDRFAKNLRSLVASIRRTGARAILCDIAEHDVARRGSHMSTILSCDVTAMFKVAGEQPESDRRLKAYRAAARVVAADCGLQIAAFADQLTEYPLDKVVGYDGIHPTDFAHEIIAQSLLPQLRAALQPASPAGAYAS